MAAKIKRGDQVTVMTGKSKGHVGTVTSVITKTGRAYVEGANMVKKHRKPSQTSPGGMEDMEAPIDLSNLMIVDPSDNKPCRIGFRLEEDGSKVRISKRTGEVIPEPDWKSA